MGLVIFLQQIVWISNWRNCLLMHEYNTKLIAKLTDCMALVTESAMRSWSIVPFSLLTLARKVRIMEGQTSNRNSVMILTRITVILEVE